MNKVLCQKWILLVLGIIVAAGTVRGDWAVETIDDAGDVGLCTSIAINSQNRPHISYYDADNEDLKYAYRTESAWHVETAYSEGNAGEDTDLALTSEDKPYISFYDIDAGAIKMTWNTTNIWQTISITASIGAPTMSSIALDSQDRFCVAYLPYESTVEKVKITYTDGFDVYTTYAETDADQVYTLSLAFDQDDHPCLSYNFQNGANHMLKFARFNYTAWSYDFINMDNSCGWHSVLKFDSSLYPRIVHMDPDSSEILLSSKDTTGWRHESSEYPVSGAFDMCLDSEDYPHIVSQTDQDNTVRHYYKDGSGWHSEIVYQQPDSGLIYPSIGIDDTQHLHISFYGREDGSLKYARQVDPATPTPTSTPEPGTTVTPTATPDPGATQTPTPAGCTETGVRIEMPASSFAPGDVCSCTATVCNAEGASLSGYPLFVILDVYQNYYFAPSFNDSFDNYASQYALFPVGETPVQVLPPFEWPSGAGSANGIIWYGALTNPGMTELFGSLGTLSFGWTD